jgi:hypothetical protein
VRQALRRRWPVLLLAPVPVVIALTVGGHSGAVALAAYLGLVTALLVTAAASSLGRALPPSRLLGRPTRGSAGEAGQKLEQLTWIERLVSRAYGSTDGLVRLRPVLAQVTSAELERAHGVSLERQPARARELVGEPLWAIVAGDPLALPGSLEVDELRRLIDELEAIA